METFCKRKRSTEEEEEKEKKKKNKRRRRNVLKSVQNIDIFLQSDTNVATWCTRRPNDVLWLLPY